MPLHMSIPINDLGDSILLVVFLGATARRYLKRSGAISWPLAEGRIERVREEEFSQPATGALSGVALSYSFKVNGEFYSGSVTLPLTPEDVAYELVLCLKDQPVKISYRPDAPDVNTLLEEQFNHVRQRVLGHELRHVAGAQTDFILPAPLRTAGWTLFALTGAALGMVLCAHLAALAGYLVFARQTLLSLTLSVMGGSLLVALARIALYYLNAVFTTRPPTLLGWLVNVSFGFTAVYSLLGRFILDPHNPLFARQSSCSAGEFVCLMVMTTLYSMIFARKALPLSIAPQPDPIAAG